MSPEAMPEHQFKVSLEITKGRLKEITSGRKRELSQENSPICHNRISMTYAEAESFRHMQEVELHTSAVRCQNC